MEGILLSYQLLKANKHRKSFGGVLWTTIVVNDFKTLLRCQVNVNFSGDSCRDDGWTWSRRKMFDDVCTIRTYVPEKGEVVKWAKSKGARQPGRNIYNYRPIPSLRWKRTGFCRTGRAGSLLIVNTVPAAFSCQNCEWERCVNRVHTW